MKKLLFVSLLCAMSLPSFAQRVTDRLDRGLVAMKSGTGVYLTWRVLGEEYYDVTYNVYRDGTKLNGEPLKVSNYRDTQGTADNTYTVRAVVRGTEQKDCAAVSPWASSYKEIKLTHEGIKSTLVPNDACCADVDGDGELEILMKFDNLSEMQQSYPRMGPTIDGTATGEYSIFEVLKQDGTRLWWVNCGPNMGDFQNNEQNIVGYDWDGDGKAEVVMRAADGTVIHLADGTTYTVGNASTNVRAATGGGTNWFVTTDGEYLLYLDGQTGKPYQCIPYPLKRLESGETDLNKAWGDGYGHRCSKHFFGAPYLDGRKPSIFLARGIYTRHKMIAYDVDPDTHKLKTRWTWYNNSNGPWKGQGYHNFGIADVDWDGRDEIVFGSMVIDDNGKGLSTTGLGHGDAQHCSDFNPYIHGQEIYACLEDNSGNNYRDATTSKIYHRCIAGNDDGRSMAGNFTNAFPGSLGCSAREGAISLITNEAVNGLDATGVNTNFRIYWDGDLCSETFNYLNGKNTEGCIAKYGSWSPIYTMTGSLTNNDTKGTPCYQGDILGDWREEVIMRTADNNIRIYSTPTATSFRIPTLWSDHQYRNAMVWQMCGYNQPPHLSYFIGQMEGITQAPPPLTMTERTEVKNGESINASQNGQHVIVCETDNSSVTIEQGAMPYILTFNVPTWVQGSAASECTTKDTKINYTTYTCTVTGGGLAGEARLVKQGDGVLTLPKADFTHTGETNIWAGVLNFDGTMKNSPLWLNRFAELNSNGGEFLSIKADYGSVIRPGGENVKGTITTEELSLGFGSRMVIDLYADDITADVIRAKTINIERKKGSAWENGGPEYLTPVIALVGNLGSTAKQMTSGKYVIAEFENMEGSVDDIVVEGLATTKKKLYVEDSKIILEIIGLRDATTVEWLGTGGSNWDYADTENFAIEGEEGASVFVSGDNVHFTDDAALKTIKVLGEVYPDSFVVNNTISYTFGGDGSIAGDAKFVKQGKGIVNMNGNNTYTGGNYLSGGTVKVSQLSNQYSESGNLGGITKVASKFKMENGATLQTTAAVEQGSPMMMVGEEGGVINNNDDFRMGAALSGTTLTKKGNGCLFMANSSLSRLIIGAGSVAETSNPAATVEFQGGTLYDDAQCTTHAIYVPKGKAGTWQLTYAYYTAYNNKVTGEGTLTIVPRNTVSRVRIIGDWSQFQGTIKHTTTNIWLPLDCSTGMPHATLDLAAGCGITNVCKSFTIGALTGSGSLNQPVANFQNSSAVSGNNTWNVGNSDDKDFTFAGTITDNGSTNHVLFNKVGTCKMTFTGSGDFQGACRVNEGELCLNSSKTAIMLGSSTLNVAKGAMLSGKGVLGNSSVTVAAGATIRSGITETNATGNLKFSGKNVTVNGNIQTFIGTKTSYSKFTEIGTLTLNGTLIVRGRESLALSVGDEIQIFDASTIKLGTNLQFDLCSPNTELGLTWDTSRLTEGILVVAPAADGILSIDASELSNAEIFTLNGIKLKKRPTRPGVYVINGRKVQLK